MSKKTVNYEIYGFSLGNTGPVLYKLKNIDCCYLVLSNNIDHYLDMLLHAQPKYILGMGSYSGVDQKEIRIETKYSNKFRNDYSEGTDYAEVEMQPFLKLNNSLKLANAIGNSYCNLVSWRISQLIHQQKLHSKYTFLHIPKSMQRRHASQIIDEALMVLRTA